MYLLYLVQQIHLPVVYLQLVPVVNTVTPSAARFLSTAFATASLACRVATDSSSAYGACPIGAVCPIAAAGGCAPDCPCECVALCGRGPSRAPAACPCLNLLHGAVNGRASRLRARWSALRTRGPGTRSDLPAACCCVCGPQRRRKADEEKEPQPSHC